MLTHDEGVEIVELARHAIETLLFNQPLNLEPYKRFDQSQGIFVTLKKEKELRGQMGTVETKDPLYKAVLKAARDAAFHDKRFDPVNEDEIQEIQVEVAVLYNAKLLRVNNYEEYSELISPEADGLMMQAGIYRAVMLPNPEMRYGWDVERVLRHLCISAGMTMDAWKGMTNNIYTFQAQVFAERAGKVVELV